MIVQRTALSRHIAVSEAQIAQHFARIVEKQLAAELREKEAAEEAARIEEERLAAEEEARLDAIAARWRFEQKRAEKSIRLAIVPLGAIMKACADAYGVSVLDILSHRRTAEVVRPRQIAMYLAKIMTTRSLPEIGRRIGDRDHTTVLWGVRKITALIKQDPKFAAEVEAIRQAILAP